MSVVGIQTREDKRGYIGRENIDGVALGRTATVDLMDPTPSLAEEQLTKSRPAQRIGRGIAKLATVY